MKENYYFVPSYIVKLVKKLSKLRVNEVEIISQIKDYLEIHNIPVDISLELLKCNSKDDELPGQLKLNI